MASPQLRPKTRTLTPRGWSSESSALRLPSAERPEEIDVARAEEEGTDAARLKAYAALKEMMAWLEARADEPELGAPPRVPLVRLG